MMKLKVSAIQYKFIEDDLETRYRHYLPKLSGLQDNIKDIKIEFKENEYKQFIYDYNKIL